MTFLKRILILCCIFQGAFGYDFSHCMRYYDLATQNFSSNIRSVSIKSDKGDISIAFSPHPLTNPDIIKSDPFVGLYILKVPKTKFSYHFLNIDNFAKTNELASIGLNFNAKGKIVKNQTGFIDYAKFSSKVPLNGTISNICYQIYGLGVGENHFIDKVYLNRFLNEKSPYYGDIGIRVIQEKGNVFVYEIDPFFSDNPFMLGDVILSIDGKKISTYQQFEWLISNAAYNKALKVEIIRDDQKMTLNPIVNQRYGGFLLPDTFLERFGISVNNDLEIIKYNQKMDFQKYNSDSWFKLGDKIIWINGQPILNQANLSYNDKLKALRRAFTRAYDNQKMDVVVMRNGLEIHLILFGEN